MTDKDFEKAYAEIMWMFRYTYKDKWAPDNIFEGKSRVWIKALNNLIEKGYIERKKEYPGFKYRWKGVWPDNY